MASLLCMAAVVDAVRAPFPSAHTPLMPAQENWNFMARFLVWSLVLTLGSQAASNKTSDHILVGPLDAKESADFFIFIVGPYLPCTVHFLLYWRPLCGPLGSQILTLRIPVRLH